MKRAGGSCVGGRALANLSTPRTTSSITTRLSRLDLNLHINSFRLRRFLNNLIHAKHARRGLDRSIWSPLTIRYPCLFVHDRPVLPLSMSLSLPHLSTSSFNNIIFRKDWPVVLYSCPPSCLLPFSFGNCSLPLYARTPGIVCQLVNQPVSFLLPFSCFGKRPSTPNGTHCRN